MYNGAGYAGIFPTSNTANANDLGNNQYLIFGHDNNDFDFATPILSPFGVNYCEGQMNRVYKVVDVGSVSSCLLYTSDAADE